MSVTISVERALVFEVSIKKQIRVAIENTETLTFSGSAFREHLDPGVAK